MKFTSINQWAYFVGCDEYATDCCDTKKEAIDKLISYEENGEVGELYKIDFTEDDVPDYTEEIFLGLLESLCEEVGDSGEDWELEHSEELQKDIAKAVIKHINKYKSQPTGYYVAKNIEEIEWKEERLKYENSKKNV